MFKAESWAALIRDHQVFVNGLLVTVEMALVGFVIASILGVIFVFFATSGKKLLVIFNRIYVEFFQNTPLMLQALFLFYAVTFSGNSDFTPLTAGMISLGIYHGAYFSEVIRAGIEAIPRGQLEAAYSQGFSYIQTMQYIVIPQTLKIILPPMVNQIVALIKNTSCMLLVGGAVDLISTANAYAVGASTAQYAAAAYVFSGLLFFVICFPLSSLASHWEQKLKKRDQENGYTKPEISDSELDKLIDKTDEKKINSEMPEGHKEEGDL